MGSGSDEDIHILRCGFIASETTLVLFVVYSFADLWWETTAAVETIRLLKSEGVRENDFYW